jgi:hypothetical protein
MVTSSHPPPQFLSEGRFDAAKTAVVLEWSQEDVAAYLGKTPGALSRNPTSSTGQDELARLVGLVQRVYELNDNDIGLTRAWFRLPIRALEKQSPKKLIVERQLETVENLVDEYDSQLAF